MYNFHKTLAQVSLLAKYVWMPGSIKTPELLCDFPGPIWSSGVKPKGIIMFKKIAGIIVFSMLCLAANVVFAADAPKPKPDATIEFSGGSVALGIGYSWGSGDIKYKGKTYKIKIEGLSAGEVGGTSVKATGTVYNLKQIGDIEGKFLAGTVGGTMIGGGTRSDLKNEKGVQMTLETMTKGVSLKVAVEGVKINLQK